RSPLFRHRILRRIDDPHSPAGRSGLAQFLRVDARILEYLLGGETPDARLSDHAILFHPVARPEELVVDPALRAKVLNLRECFASSSRGTGSLVVFLEGPDEPGTRDVVL